MKTCGIKLDKNIIRFILLEQNGEEVEILKVQENFFSLKDAVTSEGFNAFKDVVYSFFDNHSPEKIGVLSRLSSGKLQSHGVTFKIEGMLQLYPSKAIEIVAKKTINSYLKKNPHGLTPDYTNQQDALDLAYFLLYN